MWYYSKNGSQLGPVSVEDLKAKLASGEISPTDLVWKEGMGDWVAAGQVGELHGAVSSPGTLPSPGGAASPYTPPATPAYGSPAPMGYSGPEIPNYLWQSIVVTILCCWPLGIPAIVYAAKVDGLKARGDIAGAMAASKSAKTWTSVAFGCGLVIVLIYVIAIAAGGLSQVHSR